MTSRRRLLVGGLAVAAAAIGVGLWLATRGPVADRGAATAANNRGVGLMERFDYPAAAAAFADARRLDPGWLVPRLNHAVALLNTAADPNLDAARDELRGVLADRPDDPHAHFNLGIIALHRNRLDEAREHLTAVTRIDPADAAAWYHLGAAHPPGSADADRCFETAYRLNPYLAPAVYGLAMNRRRTDPARSAELLDEHRRLTEAGWDDPARIRYSEMGKYGDVIGGEPGDAPAPPPGPLPAFAPGPLTVELAPGTAWAATPPPELADLRARYGGTLVPFDFDGDDRTDLFLAAAVTRGGAVGDLLLHNRGDGRFADTTAAAGLAGPPSAGVAIGDFDNDGRPDLALTSAAGVRLLRNAGRRFADVTAEAGLTAVRGPALGGGWVDLDQDGDLDLLIARPEPAGGLAVLLNVGEAPPGEPNRPPPPLTARFRPADLPGLTGTPAAAVAAADLDDDRDVDLVLFGDAAPVIVRNDRLLRFRRTAVDLAPPGWAAGLVLDADGDGRTDLFAVAPDRRPAVWRSAADPAGFALRPGAAGGPPLRQAAAADPDLDGAADVVGLSDRGVPAFLHNQAGRLVHRPEALGRDAEWPADLVAAAPADLDADGRADAVVWSAAGGVSWRRNLGNGNRGLRLLLTGRRDRSTAVRTNADGVGAKVLAHAGAVRAAAENTTLSAGLGQPRGPLVLGLSRADRADVVRIRWPDGVPQAELDLSAGPLHRIPETSRKTTSCPVVFAWDGRRWAFVTDCLGAAAVGELQPDGTARTPRPEEWVRLTPAPVPDADGTVRVKLAEPLDEVLFLDAVRLIAVDHPPGTEVVPDERFPGSGPPPTGDLLVLGPAVVPAAARDHRGRDVTAAVSAADGSFAAGFARRGWLGYAEDHWVELDFADRLARYAPTDRLVIELHGWTDYPYPESIWAAAQAGVPLRPPTLDRAAAGGWRELGEVGFPAGLPRTIVRDATGWLSGPACRLRLRTNMQVGWDRVSVRRVVGAAAPGRAADGVAAASVAVASAELREAGLAKEVGGPDGPDGPVGYDDDARDRVPVTDWDGRFPPPGDATAAVREPDGRAVAVGPGREVECRFRPPPPPAGMSRTYVLWVRGHTRDVAPFTADGGRLTPPP